MVENFQDQDRMGALIEAISLYGEVYQSFSYACPHESPEAQLFRRFVSADLAHLDWIYNRIQLYSKWETLYEPDPSEITEKTLGRWKESISVLKKDYLQYLPIALKFEIPVKHQLIQQVSGEDPIQIVTLWRELTQEVGKLWKCFNDRIKTCSYGVATVVIGQNQEEGIPLLKDAADAIEEFLKMDAKSRGFYENLYLKGLTQIQAGSSDRVAS